MVIVSFLFLLAELPRPQVHANIRAYLINSVDKYRYILVAAFHRADVAAHLRQLRFVYCGRVLALQRELRDVRTHLVKVVVLLTLRNHRPQGGINLRNMLDLAVLLLAVSS
jgi:hypothetical protein